MNKLIDINGNIIVTSDETIEIGDYCYGCNINGATNLNDSIHQAGSHSIHFKYPKIIASLSPIEGVKPLLNSRTELLQMIKEKEIERLAGTTWEEINKFYEKSGDVNPTPFIAGFKAGAKLSSFKEEQMIGFATWIRENNWEVITYPIKSEEHLKGRYFKAKDIKEYEQFYPNESELLTLYLSSQPIPTIEVTIQEVDGGVKITGVK